MNIKLGDKLTNAVDFTSAIGEHFRAGTVFTVIQVGSVNSRASAPNGSLVWISNNKSFFTGNGY